MPEPEALRRRPKLDEGLVFLWDAFWEVSTDRPIVAMAGAFDIPFRAIKGYAEAYGISFGEEFDQFRAVIRRLDRVYLDTKAKSGADAGGGESGDTEDGVSVPKRSIRPSRADARGR